MRFTTEYRDLNRQLHAADPRYGIKGIVLRAYVEEIAAILNTTSILDYGCGKGRLAASLPGLPIREYDFAIDGKEAEPEPADLVVCADVLEHIEPECVEDVLDHLLALVRKVGLFSIHCGQAKRRLPDGRNTHLSAHSASWWIERINRRWLIAQMGYETPQLTIIVRPFEEPQS